MVFSRLLGGAYGCSPRMASCEMGLVGQDSFIVLDEAHISEVKIKVLDFVAKHNHSMRPLWWTTMSATLRQDADFTLSDDDLTLMAAKLNAHKSATLIKVDAKDLVPSVLNVVERHSQPWNRLIIYLEKPADADRIYKALRKKGYDCLLLTGTMRGYEKAKLDFSPFKTSHPDGKHVLIATSAAEAGLDVSCEFLITEVATAERLAQRFGRCNRWSESDEAFVYVVKPEREKKEDEKLSGKQVAIAVTVDYLKTLERNVSTGNLYRHPIPAEAFSPVPATVSLNKASLLQIANTTYPSLEVNDYIRGAVDEYHVNLVIRQDAEIHRLLSLAAADLTSEAFDRLPIANNELFKEIPRNFLKKIASAHAGSRFFFISRSGAVKERDCSVAPSLLGGGTVFLPESANLINPQGLCEVDGGGEGDVFSKVQDPTTRFVQNLREDIPFAASIDFTQSLRVDEVRGLR